MNWDERGTTSGKEFLVSGVLKDFQGNPLAGGEVRLIDYEWCDRMRTTTDATGMFSLNVPQYTYNALYVCKDYKVKNLEFWFWDMPVNRDIQLAICIDGLEVYGIKAWRTYHGALVYFRPMSLKRYQSLDLSDKGKVPLIAPNLEIDDVKITLDDKRILILGMSKVREAVDDRSNYMDSFLLSIEVPPKKLGAAWQMLGIELIDRETGERGFGCAPLW